MKHHSDVGQEDLFLIMMSGNDVMIGTDEKDEKIIKEAITEIHNTLKILASKHVKHIIFANFPNIDCIPEFLYTEE